MVSSAKVKHSSLSKLFDKTEMLSLDSPALDSPADMWYGQGPRTLQSVVCLSPVWIHINHLKNFESFQNFNIIQRFVPPQIWAPSSRTSLPCCFRTLRTLRGRRASARSGWRSTPSSASGPPLLSSSFSSLSSTSPTARTSWKAPWMWWWTCQTDKAFDRLASFEWLHFCDGLSLILTDLTWYRTALGCMLTQLPEQFERHGPIYWLEFSLYIKLYDYVQQLNRFLKVKCEHHASVKFYRIKKLIRFPYQCLTSHPNEDTLHLSLE